MQHLVAAENDLFPLTYHARSRMAQRNISIADLSFILCYGEVFHVAGAVHYYLRRADIPSEALKQADLSRLEGTTVIVSREMDKVITVYRSGKKNRKHIACKKPYFH